MALNLRSTRFTPAQLAKKEKERKLLEQAAQKTADRRTAIKTGDDPALQNVKTVGENLFLTNVLPIKKGDNIAEKAGKAAVNAGLSVLSAPGEALRHVSLLASGKTDIPKNTSFTEDILPTSASDSINKLAEKRPILGGLAKMGLDTVADPTTYITGGTAKSLLTPRELGLGKLAKVKNELPKAEVEAPKVDDVDDFFDLEGKQGIDFTADQFGNVRRGEAQEALPAGKQPLMLQPGQTLKALSGRQPLMLPEGYTPNFETPHPYQTDSVLGRLSTDVTKQSENGLFINQKELNNFIKKREQQIVESQKSSTDPFAGMREPNEVPMITAEVSKTPELLTAKINKALDEATQRLKERNEIYKPGNMNAVARNPLEDIRDLTIIGAGKIAKGTIEFAQWSKEMIDEFGQIIEKQLPGIWKHSNLLVQKGETVLKYKGNEMPVKWQAENAAPKAGNLPGVTSGQTKTQNVTTGAGEANAVKWREGDPLPAPQSKIVMQKPKEGFDFKGAMNKFYTHFVNTQQAIVNTGKAAGSNLGKIASNTRNASGIVDHNFLEAMVDKNGNKVGASLKEVAESIPKGKEEDFWTYMSQRHNIDRAREGKPVQTNYSPEMSTKAAQIAESQNPEFKAAGDAITQWIDKFMQTWGVDTGIVNKDIYASLREMYPSYFPTQREFSELEKSIPDGLSQKFADLSSPVRKAKGSDRDITNPLENIMQLVSRTIRTAKYNEVGQSLLESVNKNPEKMKPLAEIVSVKDGMFSNTDNIISVLVDGKPQYLKINDKPLLDAMNGLPKKIHDVPFVTALTQAVKNTITQKNPLFAIRNIMRDVPTSYVYGSEANPLRFARDLGKAGKDIATNSERFQKYKAVGGSGANFFSSGEASKAAADLAGQGSKLGKLAKAPLDAIAKFNNLTETAPRLAEFNRVLDKTGNVTEALYAAGEVTVNFGRSGNITKTLDKAGGMYINAGVQGIDRFFRAFKDTDTALKTLTKAGVAITAPDIALYVINHDNPYYQQLDNRTKDTYFLIPNEFDRDENGQAKTFIKVPKSRELGVLFGSLFERSLRALEGQDDSFKGFGNTMATNFAPANPLESNLITPALINIPRNKDFADRPIVPLGMEMDNRPAYLQYDEKSTEIAKKIGELTKGLPGLEGGLSPKQIDYLVKSYTGVIAQIGQPLATKGGGGSGVGKVLKNQFVADPLFSNQATTDFYDKLGKLSAKATEKNIKQNIPSEEVTPEEDIKNSMNAVSQALSRGTKQINKINATTDPNKEAKIKAIKKKMLFLTDKANKANTSGAMQAVEDKAKELFPK